MYFQVVLVINIVGTLKNQHQLPCQINIILVFFFISLSQNLMKFGTYFVVHIYTKKSIKLCLNSSNGFQKLSV